MTKAAPIFRILAVVLILASLGMIFVPWIVPGKELSFLDIDTLSGLVRSFWKATLDLMKDGFDLSKSTTTDILTGAAMILLVVTALLAIVLAACGVRWGAIPYAVASILLTVAIYLTYLKGLNEYFFWYYGLRPFHMGIGMILFPLLAIMASLRLLFSRTEAG